MDPVLIVGAGLAGVEAAAQLARRGVPVRLLEMKPLRYSPAHHLPGPAELVCSNSLKSDDPDSAHGLLKQELEALGSVVMEAARLARVPAGTALAVDRRRFSAEVERILAREPGIRFQPGEEILQVPGPEVDAILATGPLTAQALAESLKALLGEGDDLYFYDALAPIIDAESIDMSKAFFQSRWDKGETHDYLNCPLTEEEYRGFVAALLQAPRVAPRDFEEPRYFEGCLPIEVLAERGQETLAFGPMRPVGLSHQGKRPYAVVQLRAENRERLAFNLVGFQTKLTQEGQRQVLTRIPGLEQAQFLRYGAVHRNLYIEAPKVLGPGQELKVRPRLRLAGQMVGVEGYMESAASGLLAGMWMAQQLCGQARLDPPRATALGSLVAHVRGEEQTAVRYEPMNIHFGLLPRAPGRGKHERRAHAITRARAALGDWLVELGLPVPEAVCDPAREPGA